MGNMEISLAKKDRRNFARTGLDKTPDLLGAPAAKVVGPSGIDPTATERAGSRALCRCRFTAPPRSAASPVCNSVQRVDLVRPCRMGHTRGEPAPKMHDRYIAVDRDDADQLICERRIPVDRFMNRFVKTNDLWQRLERNARTDLQRSRRHGKAHRQPLYRERS
jgi:hypothetical protein